MLLHHNTMIHNWGSICIVKLLPPSMYYKINIYLGNAVMEWRSVGKGVNTPRVGDEDQEE